MVNMVPRNRGQPSAVRNLKPTLLLTYTEGSSRSNDRIGISGMLQEDAIFGLEMQMPWSRYLLEGRKKIEVRSYPLPSELLGRQIYVLESQPGIDGVSSLPDRIELHGNRSAGVKTSGECQVIGRCIFRSIREYTCKTGFEADEGYHLVAPTSGYAWKEGSTNVLYGWIVQEYHILGSDTTDKPTENNRDDFRLAIRRKRSIFQLYKQK